MELDKGGGGGKAASAPPTTPIITARAWFIFMFYIITLRGPTSSWRPFRPALGSSGLLDFVLRALKPEREQQEQEELCILGVGRIIDVYLEIKGEKVLR